MPSVPHASQYTCPHCGLKKMEKIIEHGFRLTIYWNCHNCHKEWLLKGDRFVEKKTYDDGRYTLG